MIESDDPKYIAAMAGDWLSSLKYHKKTTRISKSWRLRRLTWTAVTIFSNPLRHVPQHRWWR
jgi:hypothetical protein